ncbi:MAG: DUF835 domain-containing protein [Thermoplasmatota archaeon]
MVDFGKILGGKEKKADEEEPDEDDIDDLLNEADDDIMGGGGIDDMDSGGGIGPEAGGGGGGMGMAPDMRDDISKNEEEIREVKTEMETLDETVDNMDERVKNIEEDISQLLDVYEMVTAEFNPFLEDTGSSEQNKENDKTEIDLGVSMGGGGQAPQQAPQQQESMPSFDELPGPEQQSPQQAPPQQEAQQSPPESPPQQQQPQQQEPRQEQSTPPDQAPQQADQSTPQPPLQQPQDIEGPSETQPTPDTETSSQEPPSFDQVDESAQPPSPEPTQTESKSIQPSKYMPQQSTMAESSEKEETIKRDYTDENVISVKKQLEDGSTYLIEDDTLDFAYDVFSKLVNTDTKTLCVTRKHPEKIQDKYNIGDTDFVWLSTSNEAIAVGPQQLDVLSLTIEGFLSDEGDAILIDGLGYLFSNNPVSTIVQFLQSVQDQIATGNTTLIFAVSPSSIEDKYYNLIKNELNPEIISLAEKSKAEDTTVQKEGSEDLVDDMKNMVSYLEDEERELEEKVDQLNKVSSPNQSGTSDVVMDAINSLRKEIDSIRDQLNKQEGKTVEKETPKETEGVQKTEEPDTRDEKIRDIVKEKEEKEPTEEKITDDKIKEIIDLVQERIKTEEEGSEIPDEYIERIIDEVKKELKTEEKEPAEERIIKDEDVGSPEIEKETFEDKTAEKETEETKTKEPTVGDILKTVEREKEQQKEEQAKEEKIRIEEGIHVKGSLESNNDIVLKDKSTIDGDVLSRNGNVTVGKECNIKGKVKGVKVDISDNSEIEEIDAEENIVLGKDVNVKRISTDGNVELHKGVTVEEEIEYGEHLFFKGDGIKVGNLIHPIKNDEVVEEQWVSQ